MNAFIPFVLAALGIVGGVQPGTLQVGSLNFAKVYCISVPPDALKRTPEWRDTAKEPPFSALKAWNLADARRKELVQDSDDYVWEFRSAKLQPPVSDRWYYEFRYEAQFQKGPTTGLTPHLVVVVLMDGTVPEPLVWERHKFMRAVREGAFEIRHPVKTK